MTEATAVLIVGILTCLVGIGVGVSSHRTARAIQQENAELKSAEFRSSEAITLKSMVDQQTIVADGLRRELFSCQEQHLESVRVRTQLDARVRQLEEDNTFLKLQLDSWARRDAHE